MRDMSRHQQQIKEIEIGSGHVLWFFDRLREANGGKDIADMAKLRKALEEECHKVLQAIVK